MTRGPKPKAGVGSSAPPPTGAMTPPAYFTARQAEIFNVIVAALEAQGNNFPAHSQIVEQLAIRLNDIERLNTILEAEGTTYEVKKVLENNEVITTGYRARPEFAQRSDSQRHATQILSELGLTPSAIGRIKTAPAAGPGQTTGFEEF